MAAFRLKFQGLYTDVDITPEILSRKSAKIIPKIDEPLDSEQALRKILRTSVPLWTLAAWIASSSLIAAEGTTRGPLPRTLVALFDSKQSSDIWYSPTHQFAEMPLNYLGVWLEYYDIQGAMPDLSERKDVLGVISWLPIDSMVPDPEKHIQWIAKTIDAGKKFVLMGVPGFYPDFKPLPIETVNELWRRIGLEDADGWVVDTYNLEFIKQDPVISPFERHYSDVLPPFSRIVKINDAVNTALIARAQGNPETESILVATGPNGGYVAQGYEKLEIQNATEDFRQWYINPFTFFERAYALEGRPCPDPTTLAGRRIYYSQVDGDGWNNMTEHENYRYPRAISAEVLYYEIVKKYPELPITIAPIAADIDPSWVGTEESRKAARKIFAEPHVEIGSHTYSHPFSWWFFEHYNEDEEGFFASNYRYGYWGGNRVWAKVKALFDKEKYIEGKDKGSTREEEKTIEAVLQWYVVPRAYANKPFDIHEEVQGSLDEINKLAPPDKKVDVYQWSGNTQPFEESIRLTQVAGIANLNGGDTRFDGEFPSYGWVRPFGRRVGNQQQIYASSSNENTYTDHWTKNFFSLNRLPDTLWNTEVPIRVKPINLYFHVYSAEKLASLSAVKHNLDFILTQNIIPIHASHYAKIAQGFYTTAIVPVSDRAWKILDRGALQTIRFDKSFLATVDFANSRGIVGQRHLHGSLYVYLDEAEAEPVIALEKTDTFGEEPHASRSYLIDSRWRVWQVSRPSDGSVQFTAQGFGSGEMRWKVPQDGRYRIGWKDAEAHGEFSVSAVARELMFSLKENGFKPVEVTVEYASN